MKDKAFKVLIRLDDAVRAKLDAIAIRKKIDRSSLIRDAIAALITREENPDGSIHLPDVDADTTNSATASSTPAPVHHYTSREFGIVPTPSGAIHFLEPRHWQRAKTLLD